MAKDPSRTERATPKRRNKVRSEGNVPKSQEISKTVTILAGLIGLYAYFSVLAGHARDVFRYFFANAVTLPLTQQNAYAVFILAVKETAIMVLPVICLIGLVSFLVLRRQVGRLWTTKVFGFKLKNFNLLAGLKRMFASPQTLVRFGKSIALALGTSSPSSRWYSTDRVPILFRMVNFMRLKKSTK